MSLKMAIVVLTCNQIEYTKTFWGNLIEMTADKQSDVGLCVVDNGSSDGTIQFLQRYVFRHFPARNLIQNATNQGIFIGYNQGWQSIMADCYAFIHNDFFIYQPCWNQAILQIYQDNPWVGLIGFAGSRTAERDGGRSPPYSNLLEAEAHGERIAGVRSCAVLDGMGMIARRRLLEQIGGFDEDYPKHHYYDKDLSMASLNAGWVNVVSAVFCHHWSGVTSNTISEVRDNHDIAHARYLSKWGHLLPWSA
jgi:GT2 family glycosyltransferase